MLNDAVQAIIQMFSPPLRAVLWKSIGLALALIVVVGFVLERLIVHLIGAGSASVETTLGPQAHAPASAIAWLLLSAKSHAGSGVFSNVSSIQRLNTAGGKAPAEACGADNVEQLARVPYTAEYIFYVPKR